MKTFAYQNLTKNLEADLRSLSKFDTKLFE